MQNKTKKKKQGYQNDKKTGFSWRRSFYPKGQFAYYNCIKQNALLTDKGLLKGCAHQPDTLPHPLKKHRPLHVIGVRTPNTPITTHHVIRLEGPKNNFFQITKKQQQRIGSENRQTNSRK